MNQRAFPEKKFLLKYLLIGLFCLGFSVYSLVDATYSYPSKIPVAKAYQELLTKIENDPGLSDKDRKPMWTKIAEENGWSTKLPKKEVTVESLEFNIKFNYFFIFLGLAAGLPCIVWYYRSRNSWIESTDDGLNSSWGQSLKLSQVTQFDKRRWEKKGIGILHYESDDGTEKTFKIDDLAYDRETTDSIVRWIESVIGYKKIVNGLPEATPEMEDQQIESADDPHDESDL